MSGVALLAEAVVQTPTWKLSRQNLDGRTGGLIDGKMD